MQVITNEDLKPYRHIDDPNRMIRQSVDFIPDVLDRFLNGTHYSGIKLPFRQFDDLFRLRQQEVTVLAGINGAGKSMLGGQIMLSAVEQGFKCLSVSMEMSPQSQIARMIRQCSLNKYPGQDEVLSWVRWQNEKLCFYDQRGTVTGDTLIALIKFAREKYGVDFVLVDSLMTLSYASDDYNGQKQIICGLANIARELDIHIMLVAHARKGQSIKDRLDKWSVAGSADITNRADNVIILGRLYEMDGADAYMSLAKARHFDGAEMDIDLKFDMNSLNYHMSGSEPSQLGMEQMNNAELREAGL